MADQELITTHSCKVCGKMFSNGRSLGGHMRSHLSLYSPFEDFFDEDDDKVSVIKKRRRVRRVAAITSDTLSVSESEKENGALSLMMLSRDKYCSIGSEEEFKKSDIPKRVSKLNSSCSKKKGKRYKCVTCSKVFSSYQALGGHRTSHRKSEAYLSSSVEETIGRISFQSRRNDDHECPICHKVFASGQALGGHKRSHLISATEETTVTIDLNFPASDS